MDLINTGTDSWILEFDSCEKLSREIMEHLNARNSEKASSQTYDALSAKIRIKLKQFSTEVSELNKKLNLASVVSTITPEERERRQRQVESLQSREHQLRDSFSQRKAIGDDSNLLYDKTRAQLFEKKKKDSVFSDRGTTSWGESRNIDYDGDNSISISEMKEAQEKLLKEQNEGLESLLKIVTGQKQIATTINDEVEHHNEILVDIAQGMDRVDNRITRATDMVTIIGKKENIWGYWLIALLLFIAILGVAFS